MKLHIKQTTAVAIAVASCIAMSAPAQARGTDKVRVGSCTGPTTTTKLKVGADDGRLEVEGQVDSNRVGQHWNWRVVHNGSLSTYGSRTTLAPSGSFTVRRTVVNLRGTDSVMFRAVNTHSREVCRTTIYF
jgi:hypothetical protein